MHYIVVLDSIFSEDNRDGILLEEGDNAFNRTNWNFMLHNTLIIRLIIITCIINLSSKETRPFVLEGEEITSAECTTQGDPFSILIYVLRFLPVLNMTRTYNTEHSTYANDISCLGKLKIMLTMWNKLNNFGPKIRYFPKAKKLWLIVKPEKYETTKDILSITNDGKKHNNTSVFTF